MIINLFCMIKPITLLHLHPLRNFSFVWFLFRGFPLPLGALDGLHYFIVALPGPPYNYFVIKHVLKIFFASKVKR